MKKANISNLKRSSSKSKSKSPKRNQDNYVSRQHYAEPQQKQRDLTYYTKDLENVELTRKNSGLTNDFQHEE
jgi:hypothetical protein